MQDLYTRKLPNYNVYIKEFLKKARLPVEHLKMYVDEFFIGNNPNHLTSKPDALDTTTTTMTTTRLQ